MGAAQVWAHEATSTWFRTRAPGCAMLLFLSHGWRMQWPGHTALKSKARLCVICLQSYDLCLVLGANIAALQPFLNGVAGRRPLALWPPLRAVCMEYVRCFGRLQLLESRWPGSVEGIGLLDCV